MSRETTEARAAAREADAAWQRHRKTCYRCMPAARRRAWGELCTEGKVRRQIRLRLEAEAKRQAELDKLPGPGEVPLFEMGDIPCDG